ncbi:U11/U12 small nuclear ribonucleoprotein 25 kDa protein-like [Actinidia eriantha]|uniref:U11/U12 small nuclear ribonucleoprotein 25 kDa protein-like n=1 Tax=Actinidia eriantha TaxID=165200 RepID=UPI00258C9A58|nr:U11/U12 small nuclear ribonucleoprotein 25 kDa protein-like [Actinidia eriantha]
MEASVTGGMTEEDNNNIDVGTGYNSNNVKKARLHSTLATILDDPILAGVPKKPALSDVDTLISLELGSAMHISVLKLDGTSIDVVVMNSSIVKDLKLAIKKKKNDMEQSKMGHRQISWKHVWANVCMFYHNEKLLFNNSQVLVPLFLTFTNYVTYELFPSPS